MSNAKTDAEELMNALLPLAKRMLREHREFFPYGGVLKDDREIVHIGATVPGESRPKSRDLIELLKQELRGWAVANGCMTTGLVYDVKVVPPGSNEKVDAIEILLDHREGYSAEVFYPYCFDEQGELKLGKMFAQRGKGEVFQDRGSQ
jgi:hypothetical protein